MSITKLAPWQSAGPATRFGANVGPNGGRRIITGMLTAGTDLSALLPDADQPHTPQPAATPFDDER